MKNAQFSWWPVLGVIGTSLLVSLYAFLIGMFCLKEKRKLTIDEVSEEDIEMPNATRGEYNPFEAQDADALYNEVRRAHGLPPVREEREVVGPTAIDRRVVDNLGVRGEDGDVVYISGPVHRDLNLAQHAAPPTVQYPNIYYPPKKPMPPPLMHLLADPNSTAPEVPAGPNNGNIWGKREEDVRKEMENRTQEHGGHTVYKPLPTVRAL